MRRTDDEFVKVRSDPDSATPRRGETLIPGLPRTDDDEQVIIDLEGGSRRRGPKEVRPLSFSLSADPSGSAFAELQNGGASSVECGGDLSKHARCLVCGEMVRFDMLRNQL